LADKSIFIRFHIVVSGNDAEKSSQADDEKRYWQKWQFKVIQGQAVLG